MIEIATIILASGFLLASVTVHEHELPSLSCNFDEGVDKLLQLEVRVSDHENYKPKLNKMSEEGFI